MRTPEEIRAAIRHLKSARAGALHAAAPLKEMEGDARRREARRDENRINAEIFARMQDLAHWMLNEPAEFSEWMEQFEKVDRIEKLGFAGRFR